MAKRKAYYNELQDDILAKRFSGDYSCYNCGLMDRPIFVLKGSVDGVWFTCEKCVDSYSWKPYVRFQWTPKLTILGEVYG